MTSGRDDISSKNPTSILKPDHHLFALAAVYGLGIGILTLAVPIAVQSLLNTVVNTAMIPFIVLLAVLLFGVLFISAILIASRDYAMELFERRILARISSEAALRLIHADPLHMDGINRAELVNRFFDIMHVQKNVPALLTEGFFIALQGIVGLVVVSFYHPFLFIYNVLFAGSVFLIWKIWSKQAIKKAIALSDSKYAVVQWLEEIARVNTAFKSERTISYALEETDNLTADYLGSKETYFKTTFAQSMAFLFLYCIASASLLGLGGVLVASNQLSLGQLVGAELIMSAIFYSTSKLGYYTSIYYELRANLDKLNYFFKLPLEDSSAKIIMDGSAAHDVTFENIIVPYRGYNFDFSCHLVRGSKTLAKSSEAACSKLFIDLLKGFRSPSEGRMLIGGQVLDDFDPHSLRNHILSVDSVSMIEGSIKRIFDLHTNDTTKASIASALQMVELDDVVKALPEGLSTHIVPSGYPLLQDEVIRLKLGAAVAAKPAILVINEIFDSVPFQQRKRILERLCQIPDMQLVVFTNRKGWDFFDHYIFIDKDGTHNFNEAGEMAHHLQLHAPELL